MRDAASISGLLKPLRLGNRVGRSYRGLDMNNMLNIVKSCLRQEVFRDVAARFDGVVVAEFGSARVRGQPVPAQSWMGEVMKMNMGIGEAQLRHDTRHLLLTFLAS